MNTCSTVVAPLTNPPYWPYPLAFAAPHRCFGHDQRCPTRRWRVTYSLFRGSKYHAHCAVCR